MVPVTVLAGGVRRPRCFNALGKQALAAAHDRSRR